MALVSLTRRRALWAVQAEGKLELDFIRGSPRCPSRVSGNIQAMRRTGDDEILMALGKQLDRARRRAARLKPKIEGDTLSWQRWSTAIENALNIVAQVSRTPAESLSGVSVKLDAVIWHLTHDEAILDAGAQRRLLALGREVRSLAARHD